MPADRTWTLYNKVLPEFTTSLGDFLSVAKYLTPLPWDADVIRAFVRRELALDMIAGNRYTTSVVTIADTLFHSEIGQAVSEWRDNQLKVVREPLEQQLIDLGVREERLDRLAASVRRTRSLDPAWWIGGTLILTLAALLGYIVSTRSHSVWVTIALAVAFCVQIIFAAYALLRSRHLAKQRWQLTSLQKELDDIRGERTRIEEVLPQLRDMRSP
jgi:hypothetical protein